MNIFLRLMRVCFLILTVIFLLPLLAQAGEEKIDFEGTAPELPGWSATMQDGNQQSEYRSASKWDVPFTVALDSENPHSGSTALKWEFSADSPGMVSLGPPYIPVHGQDVEIRFFVRTEGISEEGIFSFDESEADGKRLKGYWAVAKIPDSSDWTEVVWTGRLENVAAVVRIRMGFKSVPAGAKIWIDDITVKSGG